MWKKIKPYVVSVVIALAVGGLSSLLTMGSMDIYSKIKQPPLAPPGTVFPIVWGILFVLMGIGSGCVFVNRGKDPDGAKKALTIYGVNLVVNFFWSIIFFNLQAFLFAFLWLLLLWVIILKMIIEFKKFCPWGAYLQIPYLLWVTFAGYLTLAIYLIN